MDIRERERLERLRHTFDLNYRLTRLYASYLESFPELITKEMIEELCCGGDITPLEALRALVGEIFGLDDSRGGDERRLLREYIAPSVRLLGTEKYTENPYYKSIRLENIKSGSWELKWESYAPYRAVIVGDMETKEDYREFPPLGFFPEEFTFPAILEDGNEWMTLTPVDLDTSEEAIEAAHGRVVTFGLGLGYYAYMVSEKETVDEIFVVEKSERVIELFKKYILPQFKNAHKVKIINKDAFLYAEEDMPREHFDTAFVDTWRDASDGAPMYKRMKALEHLSPNTRFLYWIEGFLKSRLTALRFEELWDLCESGAEGAPRSYTEFLDELKRIY